MNESNGVLEQSSSGSDGAEALVKRLTDKPSVKPRSPSEEEWAQAMLDSMNRMSQDEAYRLEIASKLS